MDVIYELLYKLIYELHELQYKIGFDNIFLQIGQ